LLNIILKIYYKLLLKSIISDFIIKLHNWDNNTLINEYNLSHKLKNIINFNNYLCYFQYLYSISISII